MNKEIILASLKKSEEYFLAMALPYDADDLVQQSIKDLDEQGILVTEEEVLDVFHEEFENDNDSLEQP